MTSRWWSRCSLWRPQQAEFQFHGTVNFSPFFDAAPLFLKSTQKAPTCFLSRRLFYIGQNGRSGGFLRPRMKCGATIFMHRHENAATKKGKKLRCQHMKLAWALLVIWRELVLSLSRLFFSRLFFRSWNVTNDVTIMLFESSLEVRYCLISTKMLMASECVKFLGIWWYVLSAACRLLLQKWQF